MTRMEAIKNLEMIGIAFVEPVTEEQRRLIDTTFLMAINSLNTEQLILNEGCKNGEFDFYIGGRKFKIREVAQ